MAGLWDGAGGDHLDYTPGGFTGDGAYTIAVLTSPSGSDHGMAEWFHQGALQGLLLMFGSNLFGRSDNSSGFGPYGAGWKVFAITKPAGLAVYRMHAWAYTGDGSGVMAHGVSVGAAAHADQAAADAIQVGHALLDGAGAIAVTAMWDRELSDAELDTLKSADLADWATLAPDFGVELSAWDGNAGSVVFAGTGVFAGKTGAVPATGNPPGFSFALGPPNQAPTVNAGADQATTTGNLVTLTAVANDPDGTIATYAWTQVSGPAVALSGAGASRTFTPATAGARGFSVQVFDNDGAASPADTMLVVTTDPAPPPTPGQGLLDDADLAYMRETQTGTRPTEAALYPWSERTPDGLGGFTTGYPLLEDGQPVQVRIVKVGTNAQSDRAPVELAGRYAATELRKVVMDLVPIKPGDLLHDVDRDRWYELVSSAETQEWTTAHIVWGVATTKRPPVGP